ncbi:MAG: dTDP-4-dehydrorhamnose 3,5-epimerase family protein [Brevundimonas sp.]
MRIEPSGIDGCWLVHQPVAGDDRGWFWKLAHADIFAAHGLPTDFREIYCSMSAAGVLRGMHFQSPPHDHAKLVSCLDGRVLDVVLDLRPDSPTYGQSAGFELSREAGLSIYVPRGLAHGFLALERSTMLYNVTSVHAPSHDHGVLWNSFGFDWPVETPVLSERDQRHPALEAFASPFGGAA